MENYLLFQLYGVFSSWGEMDGFFGEVRPTSGHPTKSALLGFLGAALGIKRSETKKLIELRDNIDFFIKVIKSGSSFEDFHTIQSAPFIKNRGYRSRGEIFSIHGKNIDTILSRREYLINAFYLIAIQSNHFDLENLKETLIFPKFQLYLGRKSNTLSLPMNPQILQSINFIEALNQYQIIVEDSLEKIGCINLIKSENYSYYWEKKIEGIEGDLVTIKNDHPLYQCRQFIPRQENQLIIKRK